VLTAKNKFKNAKKFFVFLDKISDLASRENGENRKE
jgi:hypothetical protein